MKGGSEYLVTDQLFWLDQWSKITVFLLKTSRDCINSVQKSSQVFSLDVRCTRVNLERRDLGRRYWRIGGDGRIWTPRQKAQCKGSVNANQKVKISYCQSQMEQSKFLEKIKIWEHPPWSGTAQTQEKNKIIFEENQTGLLLNPTTRLVVVWWWSQKWFLVYLRRFLVTVITWNPESNCTCQLKNHSLFHWNTLTLPELPIQLWMWCRRNKLTIIETLMATENCLMHGQVSRDSFFLNEKRPDGYAWSGERLTRKQTTSRPDNVWSDMWKHMSDASKRKEKQKWAIEKPKLDSARRLRGIFFHELGNAL